MVERCVRDAEVAGSNPVASIFLLGAANPYKKTRVLRLFHAFSRCADAAVKTAYYDDCSKKCSKGPIPQKLILFGRYLHSPLADGKTYNVTAVGTKAFTAKKIRTVTVGAAAFPGQTVREVRLFLFLIYVRDMGNDSCKERGFSYNKIRMF